MSKVIDLFAGCGGLSLGFIQSGYTISKAVEFDKQIAQSYQHNHEHTLVFNKDIRDIDNEEHFMHGEADIIIGGPPCQGFSMAGARNRKGFIDDERNYLFKHYFNIVNLVKPKVFIMENVKGLLSMQDGEIFRQIKEIFANKELQGGDYYSLYPIVTNSSDFGVPQKRERIIIIGVRNKEIDLDKYLTQARIKILQEKPTFFNKVTLGEALSNLPLPTADGKVELQPCVSAYQEWINNDVTVTTNHIETKHSAKALERIKQIAVGQNFTHLDEVINSVHSGSYGRLDYDGLAPTIVTRFDTPSAGRFIHPEFDRTITPREAARIQGFPDSFEFIGSKTSICKQIGNAVPIKVAYFYAQVLKEILQDEFNTEPPTKAC